MGRTCVDQRQPGSKVSRPTTISPIRTVVADPLAIVSVSSGVERFFVRGPSVSTRVSLDAADRAVRIATSTGDGAQSGDLDGALRQAHPEAVDGGLPGRLGVGRGAQGDEQR